MRLNTELFSVQSARWPMSGRVILAQSDSDSVIVYQAYRPSIGHFAAKNGYFGGDFSLSRMTWIKPTFLWMMYRSGWGIKEDQEVTLAIRLTRNAFDELLRIAVHSTYQPHVYASLEDWKKAIAVSSVRLQWDPDHDPSGAPLARRAIQIGLRGPIAAKYARDWILDIEDISDFVAQQRQAVTTGKLDQLVTPSETVYAVTDPAVAGRLELDHGRY